MNKPNVITKIQYIECDNPRRVFYSSNSKDDYLGYIDKGVKLNNDIDYLDYTGNLEKSSGVFNQNGLLNYDSKRLIREALRNTKSCIWDLVISFETEYGLKNVDSYEDALELVKSVLPKFFKALKLKEDNIIWFGRLHTNTDNRHIHISFFEKEPMYYDAKKKAFKYRPGRINVKSCKELKMNIEKHFLSPKESMKRVRKLMIEDARSNMNSSSYLSLDKDFKWLLKELYNKLPKEGHIAYLSQNMKGCRPIVDNIIKKILNLGKHSFEYTDLDIRLQEYDNTITSIAETHNIAEDDYLLRDKFKDDLFRRMGNVIIQELINRKRFEEVEKKKLKHKKSEQAFHRKMLLEMISKSFELMNKLEDEEERIFEEYQYKLKKAEYERLVEEGVIEAEM